MKKTIFGFVMIALLQTSAFASYRVVERKACKFTRDDYSVSRVQKKTAKFLLESNDKNTLYSDVDFYVPGGYLLVTLNKDIASGVIHASSHVQSNSYHYDNSDPQAKDFAPSDKIEWTIAGGNFSCN